MSSFTSGRFQYSVFKTGAFTVRIWCWCILYYKYDEETPKLYCMVIVKAPISTVLFSPDLIASLLLQHPAAHCKKHPKPNTTKRPECQIRPQTLDTGFQNLDRRVVRGSKPHGKHESDVLHPISSKLIIPSLNRQQRLQKPRKHLETARLKETTSEGCRYPRHRCTG